jgi:hypothetical protein
MMMRTSTGFILLLSPFCAAVAHAQLGLGPNDRYACANNSDIVVAAPKPGTPEIVNATIARFPNVGFRLCTDQYGPHYFMRVQQPTVNGACLFEEAEVFLPQDPNAAGVSRLEASPAGQPVRSQAPPKPWSLARNDGLQIRIVGRSDPTQFMLEAAGQCPKPDDPDYVMVHNVSAGVLKAFTRSWRELASAEDRFNTIVAQIAPATKCEFIAGGNQFMATRIRDRVLTSLRTALFVQHHRVVVQSIVSDGPFGFAATVEDRDDAKRMRYAVDFDIGDGGVRIECLRGVVIA